MNFRHWLQLVERAQGLGDLPTTNNLNWPIAHSPEALQAFWHWFGRSKVVSKGHPLVVFHGTKASFRAFDPALSNSNTKSGVPPSAFVFSASHDVAQSYAGQKTKDWGFATESEREHYHRLLITDNNTAAAMEFFKQHAIQDVKIYKDGGNVMPCYLKMLKPLRVNGHGENWQRIWLNNDDWTTNELMSHAKERGYDGLIVRNVRDRQEGTGKPSDIYAVFSPGQIKSAIANRGTFFPTSDLIDEDDDDQAISP